MRRLDDEPQVEALGHELQLAAGHPGDVEQVVDEADHLPDLPVRTLSYGAGIYYHQLRIERILRFPHGAAAQTLTNRRTIRLIATTAKGVDKELRHCGPF